MPRSQPVCRPARNRRRWPVQLPGNDARPAIFLFSDHPSMVAHLLGSRI
jgi:hypothetical protein